MLSVEAIAGADALVRVAGTWRELEAARPQAPFYHWYGWWKCCVQFLEPDPAAVTFFVLRRGLRPVAILPLRPGGGARLGTRIWRLPNHPHIPLADLACAGGVDAGEMMAALLPALSGPERGGWDALALEPVPSDSPLAGLSAVAGLRYRRIAVKTCEEIPAGERAEDLRSRLSANFRSNLNKARNRLNREAGVEFDTLHQPADLPQALAGFMDLEASGWKGKSGTAIGQDPRLRVFYGALVDELGSAGRVVVNTLRIAGRLVAAQLCLQGGETLYLMKLAYDESWARSAPGNLLLEHVILTGAGVGARRINLVGNPAWLQDWRPTGREVHCHWIMNGSMRGLATAAMIDARQRLRPWVRRLRARRAAQPAARR